MILQDADGFLQEQRLKTLHRFGSPRFAIEFATLPQVAPTFMGATKERGRNPLSGEILYQTISDKEKIGAVSAKLRAYAHTAIPLKKDQIQTLDDKTFDKSSVTPRDELLYEKELIIRDGSEPLTDSNSSNVSTTQQKSKTDVTSKSGMIVKNAFQVGLEDVASRSGVQLATSLKDEETSLKRKLSTWAEIRWVIKVTIRRPGVLNMNERMAAPFLFLSPPEPFLIKALFKRQALMQQLNENHSISDSSLVEPSSTFSKTIIALSSKDLEGLIEEEKEILVETSRGFLSSLIFGRKKVDQAPIKKENSESWMFSIPSPAIFPIRTGAIPFILRLEDSSSKSIPSKLPIVKLFEHVIIEGKSSSRAERNREVSVGRLHLLDSLRSPYLRGGKCEYRGFLDIPSNCSSSFDAGIIKVSYSIGIRRKEDGPVLLRQPVKLLFPAPRTVNRNSLPRKPATVSYPPSSSRDRLIQPTTSPPAPTRRPIQSGKEESQNNRSVINQQIRSKSNLSQQEDQTPPPLPSKKNLQSSPTQSSSPSSQQRSNQAESSNSNIRTDLSPSRPPTPPSKSDLLSEDIQSNLPPRSISMSNFPADTKVSNPNANPQSSGSLSRNENHSTSPSEPSSSNSINQQLNSSTSLNESFQNLNNSESQVSNPNYDEEDDLEDLAELMPPSYWEVMEENRES